MLMLRKMLVLRSPVLFVSEPDYEVVSHVYRKCHKPLLDVTEL